MVEEEEEKDELRHITHTSSGIAIRKLGTALARACVEAARGAEPTADLTGGVRALTAGSTRGGVELGLDAQWLGDICCITTPG